MASSYRIPKQFPFLNYYISIDSVSCLRYTHAHTVQYYNRFEHDFFSTRRKKHVLFSKKRVISHFSFVLAYGIIWARFNVCVCVCVFLLQIGLAFYSFRCCIFLSTYELIFPVFPIKHLMYGSKIVCFFRRSFTMVIWYFWCCSFSFKLSFVMLIFERENWSMFNNFIINKCEWLGTFNISLVRVQMIINKVNICNTSETCANWKHMIVWSLNYGTVQRERERVDLLFQILNFFFKTEI